MPYTLFLKYFFVNLLISFGYAILVYILYIFDDPNKGNIILATGIRFWFFAFLHLIGIIIVAQIPTKYKTIKTWEFLLINFLCWILAIVINIALEGILPPIADAIKYRK